MAELVWSGKIPHHSSQHVSIPNIATSKLVTQGHYDPSAVTEFSSTSLSSWSNRLVLGDCLSVLPHLITEFREQINLIYIDPPFMTGRIFHHGNEIAYRDTWGNDLDSYLQWLYETLSLLYTLLSPNGSLYIHLDWRTVHYAKILLDEIFQVHNKRGGGFRNEIIWHYQSGGRSRRFFARKHDSLLLYTKSHNYCFHSDRVATRRGSTRRNNMRKEIGPDGRIQWSIRTAGRVYTYSEDTLMPPTDVWCDISHLHQRDPERNGYATQKPEALLERIILTSSEKDDLVLDCFCGSGVTPAVAERLQRRWIASDSGNTAVTLTSERLLSQQRYHTFVLQHIQEQ